MGSGSLKKLEDSFGPMRVVVILSRYDLIIFVFRALIWSERLSHFLFHDSWYTGYKTFLFHDKYVTCLKMEMVG